MKRKIERERGNDSKRAPRLEFTPGGVGLGKSHLGDSRLDLQRMDGWMSWMYGLLRLLTVDSEDNDDYEGSG